MSPFFSNHQCLEDCEKQHFFEVVLPAMVDLALSAPMLCTMASIYYKFLSDLIFVVMVKCYIRWACELQLFDNEWSFWVHMKTCFIRDES